MNGLNGQTDNSQRYAQTTGGTACGQYEGSPLTPTGYDYYHPHEAMKRLGQQYANPSMGAKLSKVAEIFELDIINDEEALKACKVIIGQHAKKQGQTDDNAKYLMPKDAITGTKVADVATTSDSIVGSAITHERLGMK